MVTKMCIVHGFLVDGHIWCVPALLPEALCEANKRVMSHSAILMRLARYWNAQREIDSSYSTEDHAHNSPRIYCPSTEEAEYVAELNDWCHSVMEFQRWQVFLQKHLSFPFAWEYSFLQCHRSGQHCHLLFKSLKLSSMVSERLVFLMQSLKVMDSRTLSVTRLGTPE